MELILGALGSNRLSCQGPYQTLEIHIECRYLLSSLKELRVKSESVLNILLNALHVPVPWKLYHGHDYVERKMMLIESLEVHMPRVNVIRAGLELPKNVSEQNWMSDGSKGTINRKECMMKMGLRVSK